MECIKDAKEQRDRIDSKKIEDGRLERTFENKEMMACMRQDFMEESRKRRSEARTCRGSTFAENLKEIGNRYKSR